MKQSRNTFLLSSVFNAPLNLEQLQHATGLYYNSFKTNGFKLPDIDALSFMLFAKREKITIGPYQNLTFFEIGNRIYSDLVLLEAAKLLFKEHGIKSIQLKMSNHAGNDIVAIDNENTTVLGEAFNTAPSYFQTKMRGELKKFRENKKGIIGFNKTALLGHENWFEGKRNQFPNITFIVCEENNINSILNGL